MEENLMENKDDEIKEIKDNDEIKKEEDIKENKDNLKDEDEECNNLLTEKDKNENEEEFIKVKNEEVILTNNNKENIDVKNEQQINNNTQNENAIIQDYLITIQYTKYFHIPYFIFGNMVNFYCPCYKFNSKIINLSQIPTPPFGINISECK